MFLAKLNAGLFPIGVLVLLLVYNRKQLKHSYAQKLYNALLLLVICAGSLDIARTRLSESAVEYYLLEDFVTNALSCIMFAGLPSVWLMYVYARVYGDDEYANDYLGIILMLLPSIANVVLTLTAPLSGLSFKIDWAIAPGERNGVIAAVILSSFVMTFSIAISVIESRRASSLESHREYLLFALFSFLPTLSQLSDVLWHHDWTVWYVYSVELVVLYINVQNTMITSDSLTGLNNRAEFDKYMSILVSRRDNDLGFYLFIIDIDDFKSINDIYGHIAGDETLRHMADILRETFGFGNAFFARIGGDEFAMILITPTQPERIIAKLKEAIIVSDERSGAKYKLSVSVGYSHYDRKSPLTAKEIFELADQAMYVQKKQRGGGSR